MISHLLDSESRLFTQPPTPAVTLTKCFRPVSKKESISLMFVLAAETLKKTNFGPSAGLVFRENQMPIVSYATKSIVTTALNRLTDRWILLY